MKIGAALISLIVPLAIAAPPARAESLALTVALPYIDDERVASLACAAYSFGEQGVVGRLSFQPDLGRGDPFSATAAWGRAGNFHFGGTMLGIPSLDSLGPSTGLSTDPFAIPAFGEGLRLGAGPWLASLFMANAFLPRVEVKSESGSLWVSSSPIFGLAGSLGWRDLSLGCLWVTGEGSFRIMGDVDVGRFSCSLKGAFLGWRGFGAIYGEASGEAGLKIKSWLSSFITIPWIEGIGELDLRFVAAWGKVRLGGLDGHVVGGAAGGAIGGGIEAAAGLLWPGGSYLGMTEGDSGGGTESRRWTMASELCGAIVLHPTFWWRHPSGLSLQVGRWIPFAWGWGTSETTGTAPSPAPGPSTDAAEAISLQTILLAGLEIIVKIEIK